MRELGLIDIWRRMHPKEKDFTFMSHVHGSYSRIDFFCTSKADLHNVKECYIDPITISDHAPVRLKFQLGQGKQFKYWRLNASVINDCKAKEEIRQQLIEYFDINNNGLVTPSILWEGAKAVTRGKIIEITSRNKKLRLAKQNEIENEIRKLETEHKQTGKIKILECLRKERKKLDDLLTYKAEGALRFVSRKYYEMSNKASRLLAFQLRKAQASRVVPKIKHPDTSTMLTQPNDIVNAFEDYYKKLYEGQELINKEEKVKIFLRTIKLNKLTEDVAKEMISPITEEEIRETIAHLKNNKSPGVDGFSGEFYKAFVNELAPNLCKMFNYVLQDEDPPHSWSDAIITVIHKTGKDPTQCMAYRPISLLCQDMKILTSKIANRIQKHIKKLVKPDQTGFINRRFGTNNIRRALNLQQIGKDSKTPSMLLSLDAEKAFDRVDWVFLEQTLNYMGFHDTFVKWVKIFYKNPKSRVRVNGHCSEFFNLGRGTRQGDAMSPVLFALSIEPLAELIRSNTRIQGITDKGGKCHKISLYADDVLLFIENPVSSIPALLECLRDYGLVSGYKVNAEKSEAMMISGRWPNQLDNEVSFRWSSKGFKYLGVTLTPMVSHLYSANYTQLFEIIKKDLARWEILPLSMFGRIETVKMNILPRLLFLFQSLPVLVPVSAFNKLEKCISKFIWQNKRPRIRLKILMSNKDTGGLNLPNLRYYYWAAQLRAMAAWLGIDKEAEWVNIEQNSLPGVSLTVLPFMDLQAQKRVKKINIWIQHTVKIWSTIQKKFRGVITLSRAIPIKGNPDFLPSICDSAFNRWEESGLKIINQIFDGETIKPFSQLCDKFTLRSNDLFRYLQLRHYITTHKHWDIIKRSPTNVEKYFINIIEHDLPTKNHIAHIYGKLMQDQSDDTFHIKINWELELNIVIEDEMWTNICAGCHKGISSQMWKEFDWKMKMRFFSVPLVVAKFDSTSPLSQCWRDCGMVGDYVHIFWECPKIQVYWQGVKREIDKVLEGDIPMRPDFFLLDSFPPDLFSKSHLFVLHILLMAARKIITVNWMKVHVPTVTEWTYKLKQIYIFEKMTADLQFKSDIFQQKWALIKNLLEINRLDIC